MMTVRLIAHTPEPEKVVAAAAKLCYSDAHITDLLDGLTEEKTASFLTMLSDLGHASPIEHASFTFGIEGVSRTLLAQITRHRIASFSVQSQRYVRLDDFRYVIPPEIEAIPEAKEAFLASMNEDAARYLDLVKKLEEGHTARLMAEGMPEKQARAKASKQANEDARFVLPNACETKMVVTMNARSLQNFFHLRCCSLTLGEPVKEFTYAFRDKDGKQVGEAKKYTPKSFYEETVGKDLNGTFLMVMNDPRRPYHKTYEVEYDRHTYDGHNWKYLNLPMEEIAQLAIASLKDGHKMYSSYDVGKQLDRKRGYLALDNFDYASLFNTSFPMNKADRIATFESGSTHAMTLSAVDLDANGKPVKWKVENSWGADNGFSGCFIMTNDWFNEYMFRLVVNKKYASEKLLKEFDQKPTMLTPDDPLFQLED